MHEPLHTCMAMCTSVEDEHLFLNMFLFLSCIQHAYILSDRILHFKLSPGQLPSEASLLPQSWSQLCSLVCITTCAFVCISLFDVDPECVCACMHVCVHYMLLCRFLCVCVCMLVLACATNTHDLYSECIVNVFVGIQPEPTVCVIKHPLKHVMWSNLLIFSSHTIETSFSLLVTKLVALH